MSGLWDRIKAFFRSGRGAEADAQIEQTVRVALIRRVSSGTTFTPVDLAADIVPSDERSDVVLEGIAAALDRLYRSGYFTPFNYVRSIDPKTIYQAVYHPASVRMPGLSLDPVRPRNSEPSEPPAASPASSRRAPAVRTPTAPSRVATTPSRASASTPYRAPPTPTRSGSPYRTVSDPYARPEIMTLTESELRSRAMRIDPYRTAWIGRVDVIPPASDDRTALIDRGLILRGLLSEAQITEIHRVGDLWLRHSEASRLAATVAARTAEEAVLRMREERLRNKVRKIAEATERKRRYREGVEHRAATDIIFLGRGVSSRLGDRRSDIEKLRGLELPVLATPKDVADVLGLSLSELRWLCFHSVAAEKTHYVHFTIPKRSGGTRTLSAPHQKLSTAQHWLLTHVLEKLKTEAPAHGFIKGHSTVTNALPHLGRDVVVNLDLEAFFPTITFGRVRGVFESLGYSPAVATVFALLATESPRATVLYDSKPYQVALGPRALPQGACTSPALSNQIARRLDRRLSGLCSVMEWTYTRYADDLTFSATEGKRGQLPVLIAKVREIVVDEGFRIQEKKGRVQRKSGRQSVTGIVVNHHTAVPRDEVRRLRAILHRAKFTGLEAQNREARPDFVRWLQGKIAYVNMVDASKGAVLQGALKEAIAASGHIASSAP
ncbi:MAG: reverse transcriptase domain-containing protein [Deltaproteobacteria bacterium]|nr:reverse transcriptase domain-containing protein [Deltaproteobacteria bacterium]